MSGASHSQRSPAYVASASSALCRDHSPLARGAVGRRFEAHADEAPRVDARSLSDRDALAQLAACPELLRRECVAARAHDRARRSQWTAMKNGTSPRHAAGEVDYSSTSFHRRAVQRRLSHLWRIAQAPLVARPPRLGVLRAAAAGARLDARRPQPRLLSGAHLGHVVPAHARRQGLVARRRRRRAGARQTRQLARRRASLAHVALVVRRYRVPQRRSTASSRASVVRFSRYITDPHDGEHTTNKELHPLRTPPTPSHVIAQTQAKLDALPGGAALRARSPAAARRRRGGRTPTRGPSPSR